MRTAKYILLVDDNIHDNFIHTYAIKKVDESFDVRSVTSGDEALEYIEKNLNDPEGYPFPDVIFLDINMPRMNGFEFIQKAREDKLLERGNAIVVIMLTSSLNPKDLQTARDLFSNEILEFKNKPLTPEMFKNILDEHFR
jgi:CheY-like chemotaxis protein